MLQKETNKVARDHKNLLGSMLGRLKDKYDVEFSVPDTSTSKSRMPLTIALNDKSVQVPLDNWGSGTQNRTYILLSVVQASRIRAKGPSDSRTTPIVLIEEPESFLHPSAQAEFGAVLQALSEEAGIQIIVSTHSPFILNQRTPKSNILLKRRINRGKTLETIIEDTSGSEWMKPFADHLGVIPAEFQEWRNVIVSSNKPLLPVEGEIDKEYLTFLRDRFPDRFQLPREVEILSYGGRGALKNTTVISFVKQIVPKVFITFDLDAQTDVQKHLEQIGLQEKRDFAPVGKNKPGKQAIEGRYQKKCQTVYAKEVDLVAAAMGETSEIRKSAKSSLKRKLLGTFKATDNYSELELKDFETLGKMISKAME
jgi:putative ATP-dependent endonuclease of OLD family